MACIPPTAAVSMPYCILAIATAEHISRHLRFAHSVDLSIESMVFFKIWSLSEGRCSQEHQQYPVINSSRLDWPTRCDCMSHGVWGEENADRYSALEMCRSA
jgi:hypothetical protein